MKIAVTSSGKTIEDNVDERFGRAPYFLIIEDDKVEAIENENLTAGGGVGVQTSQMLADKGVEAVIAGNFGPKAFQVLDAAGIKAYSASGKKVSEALDLLSQGKLEPVQGASKQSHW
ncbi:dinitrogenase iron-molybdenum cofactor biosynthesis protein [candidate division WOR-3 bacterium]|uniref:Dinitrogenase iron-molybdenum cofactor biosynthesis protein n=1 Tax=candidate division WOR-3 bacterium TaxID=2052148 RepID=A0A9D5KB27_UNCW3|nr:dinitrogenase iron-molybdenum cofactor biosynthesis protein [candidate division WOR-3 bacterium]MBD3365469.1 dinitrogenase iron-molybdenum cofactor biosynthesis protein [candidate division WOR-3 bacterium]